MIKTGFIGLGTMGAPMARNLAAGGHELFAHNRSGVPDEVAGPGVSGFGQSDHSALVQVVGRLAQRTLDSGMTAA